MTFWPKELLTPPLLREKQLWGLTGRWPHQAVPVPSVASHPPPQLWVMTRGSTVALFWPHFSHWLVLLEMWSKINLFVGWGAGGGGPTPGWLEKPPCALWRPISSFKWELFYIADDFYESTCFPLVQIYALVSCCFIRCSPPPQRETGVCHYPLFSLRTLAQRGQVSHPTCSVGYYSSQCLLPLTGKYSFHYTLKAASFMQIERNVNYRLNLNFKDLCQQSLLLWALKAPSPCHLTPDPYRHLTLC